jgi:GH15 family glucan-1,4-alpha-glucosidase
VRIGNRAARQNQMDIYGELLEIVWEWHARGRSIDQQYWLFLMDVVDTVCHRWQEQDHGIWEMCGEPRHHVHSKTMCWSVLNRSVNLARTQQLQAPVGYWEMARDDIRSAIEREGYDAKRGIFVQTFG